MQKLSNTRSESSGTEEGSSTEQSPLYDTARCSVGVGGSTSGRAASSASGRTSAAASSRARSGTGWDAQGSSVDSRGGLDALGSSALFNRDVGTSNDRTEAGALDVCLEIELLNRRVGCWGCRSCERARLGKKKDHVAVSARALGREWTSVGSDVGARVNIKGPWGRSS